MKPEGQDNQRELQFEHEQSMKLAKNPKQVEPKRGLINKTEKAPTQKRETVLCNLCGKSLKSVFYLMIKHTGAKDSLYHLQRELFFKHQAPLGTHCSKSKYKVHFILRYIALFLHEYTLTT